MALTNMFNLIWDSKFKSLSTSRQVVIADLRLCTHLFEDQYYLSSSEACKDYLSVIIMLKDIEYSVFPLVLIITIFKCLIVLATRHSMFTFDKIVCV